MKNNLFRQTKKKIIFTSISIVLFSLLIFSVIIILFYRVNLYGEIDKDLNKQIDLIQKVNQGAQITFVIPYQNQTPDAEFPHISNPKMIMIVYTTGHIIYQSANRYFEDGQSLDISKESLNKVIDFNYKNYSFRCRSIDFNGVQFILLSNTDSEQMSFTRLIRVILLSFVLLLALSIYLSVLLASKVLKPIDKSYNDQVQFVQNASHEMRTPLAIMKGKLELLAIHPNETIEENFEQFSTIMTEVYSLERLAKELLMLSKEDVDADIVKTTFDISEMVNEFSEFYGAVAESQNKHFHVEGIFDITINQDYYRFKQAIVILIENAFKYTNESDTITLRFERQDKNLFIKVSDTGIGIKDKDKEFIFERFYRSDDVRGKNIDGSGIGLSLLKSLSKISGFKIVMSSVYGQGTEFTLIYKIK